MLCVTKAATSPQPPQGAAGSKAEPRLGPEGPRGPRGAVSGKAAGLGRPCRGSARGWGAGHRPLRWGPSAPGYRGQTEPFVFCSEQGSVPGLPVPTPGTHGPSGKLSQDGLDVEGRRRGRPRSSVEPTHSRTLQGAGLRVAGGTENRPSVLYSALIKRTHHRQPLLKYPQMPWRAAAAGRTSSRSRPEGGPDRKGEGRTPAGHTRPGPPLPCPLARRGQASTPDTPPGDGTPTPTPPAPTLCPAPQGFTSKRSSKVRFDTEKRSTMYYSKPIKRI